MKKAGSILLILVMLATMIIGGFVVRADVTTNKLTYNFDTDKQGWDAPNFIITAGQLAITQEDGALKCQMLTGWRSITTQVFLSSEIDGSVYDTVHFRIKNPTPATQAKMGFGYASDPTMANLEVAEYNFEFSISANDTDYKDYYINLGQYQNWATKNDINFFRVQLCLDVVTINQSVYIDTVDIYEDDGTSSQTSTSASTSSSSTVAPNSDFNLTFNSTTEGFVSPGYLTNQSVTQENGSLRIVNATTAKHVVQLPLTQTLDGSLLSTLHIRLKNSAGAKIIQFAFATEAAGGYYADMDSQSNFVRTTIDNTDKDNYKDYYINLASNAKWATSKDVNMIRLIFIGDFEAPFLPGAVTLIDNLRIYNKAPETERIITFEDSINGWAVPGFISGVFVSNEDNAMKINNIGTSKLIVQASLDQTIDGSNLKKLHIKIKNNAGAKSVILSFGTLGANSADVDTESNRINITLNTSDTNNFIDYYVDLSSLEGWVGADDICLLRLGFYGEGGSSQLPGGSVVYVSSLRFYQSDDNTGSTDSTDTTGSFDDSDNPGTNDSDINVVLIFIVGILGMTLIIFRKKYSNV